MNHTVSVVTPCYNAEKYVCETLTTVFQQDGVDLEVIVVDDGSQDGSAELVRREFPAVQLIRTSNQGPSAARNLGTSASKGDFIQYLDADDLLERGKLDRQVRALEASGADVAYGDWARFTTGLDGERKLASPVHRLLSQPPELDLFGGFWCPPAAYLFRRTMVNRVGGWNLRLPVIQDARFALDCALRGARFIHCEGLMAYYRVHESGSVSTRSPRLFLRDCLVNAEEVFEYWKSGELLTEERRRAVADVCHQVAAESFGTDEEALEQACLLMARACPGYMPRGTRRFTLAARWLGYRRALQLGDQVRRWTGRHRGTAHG